MKNVKKLKGFVFVLVLIGTFMISAYTAQAVQPRRSLPFKWADKNATVEFRTNLNNDFVDVIKKAMATWIEVTDYNTQEPIVPMALVSDKNCPNLITIDYLGTEKGVLGKIIPYYENGILQNVTIKLNLDYPLWFEPSPKNYDIHSIILHELGHAIGIAHCHEKEDASCFSQTCSSNVMNPIFDTNETRRTLTEYETSSKQLIYW